MAVGIAFIRAINVGGRNMLPMERLRALCEGVGLCGVRTHIQSGNVVFRCAERALAGAPAKLEAAIEKDRGFRVRVMVRSLDELRRVASARVFADQERLDPGRLLVMFLADEPDGAARAAVEALRANPERVALVGKQVFLYFPDGVGTSRLSMGAVEKALGTAGTARNWNTVTRLVAMAEEAGGPSKAARKSKGRA